MRYKYTDWPKVHQLAWQLGELVEPVFTPNAIVAIARGGLVAGRLVADYFLLSDLYVVKVEFWGPQAKPSQEAKITAPLSVDLTGKYVLVVDEVADIGESLRVTKEHVYTNGATEVKTAVLQCFLPNAKTPPDFCVKRYTQLAWATYPWSITEDLNRLAQKDSHLEHIYKHSSITSVSAYLLQRYDLNAPQDVIGRALRKIYQRNIQ